MAEEVQELVVRVRPDGVDETAEQMDDMSQSFRESAGSVQESTGILESFSKRFKGAAGVIIAGLGTLAAGLLTQVPVIGDAVQGVLAIVDALALKIDQVLRPILGPLTQDMFRLADAIARLNGPAAELVGIFSTLAIIGGVVLGILAAIGVTITGPLIAAVLGIIGTIIVLAKAWQENWFNIRSIVMTAVAVVQRLLGTLLAFLRGIWKTITGVLEGDWDQVWEGIKETVSAAVDFVKTVLAGWAAAMLKIFGEMAIRLLEFADKLANRLIFAFEVLRDLIVKVLRELANMGIAAVETMVNGIIGMINDAVAAIENLVNSIASVAGNIPGVDIDPVDFGRLDKVDLGRLGTRSTGEIMASAGRRMERRDRRAEELRRNRLQGLNEQVNRLVNAMLEKDQSTEVNIDGREAAEAVEPFVGEGATGIGRTGSRVL